MEIKDVKTIKKEIKNVLNDRYFASKLIRVLFFLSASIVVLKYLDGILGTRVFECLKYLALWNEHLRLVLKRYTLYFLGLLLAYIPLREWGVKKAIEKEIELAPTPLLTNDHRSMVPFILTINDVVFLVAAIVAFAASINAVVESVKLGVELKPIWLGISFGYIVYRLIRRLYAKNCMVWSETGIGYTNYYDSKGNRIPKNAYLKYRGERYELQLLSKDDCSGREWRLVPFGKRTERSETLLLADAVIDEKGKLRIDHQNYL